MSILFLILKIIGILILIPIVLLLILLIFPICYQIEADFDGKTPKAQVKVSWAVIFLRAKAFYEENLDFGIRIFGIPIYDSRKEHWSVLGEHEEKESKKKKKDSKKSRKSKELKKSKTSKETEDSKKKKNSEKSKSVKKTTTSMQEAKNKTKIEKKRTDSQHKEQQSIEKIPDKTLKEAKKEETKRLSEDVLDLPWDEKEASKNTSSSKQAAKRLKNIIQSEEQPESIPKGEEFFGKKIVNLVKKCYNKCKNFITKITKIINKMETIGDIFEDEDIIDAVKRIKGYGVNGIKLLLPQKLNAQITFGFEDPYYTGKALGWAAALIPIYGDHIDITPDFENKILKGHLKIKGRIRRYKILHLLWKVYKDKDELIKQKDRALIMIGGN